MSNFSDADLALRKIKKELIKKINDCSSVNQVFDLSIRMGLAAISSRGLLIKKVSNCEECEHKDKKSCFSHITGEAWWCCPRLDEVTKDG